VGEALVSVLDEKGIPTIVERAGILPPRSCMSAAAEEEIVKLIDTCPLADKYAETEDRESAYELLEDLRAEAQAQAEEEARQAALEKEQKVRERAYRQTTARRTPARRTTTRRTTSRQTTLEKAVNKTINQAASTVGREIGKKIVRGLFGTFLK